MISNLPSESVYAIHHKVKSLTNKQFWRQIVKIEDYQRLTKNVKRGVQTGGVSKIKCG